MLATSEREQFDAIVIGSGIGGLTVATILTKIYKKRVLVLEQHFTPGGFTHGFKRKGKFHWDVGIHYVGEMAEGSPWRKIFDYLSDGKLTWQKIPDPFEKFVYPDFTFGVSSDINQYQADLIDKFPEEASAIKKYFQDIQTASSWLIFHGFIEAFPTFLRPLIYAIFAKFGSMSKQTTQKYLDQHFQDSHLKALLVSQWGDYGLPPAYSSFGMHGTLTTHFLQGGWYPVGGAQSISASIIPIIEAGGSKVVMQRRVTEILIEKNRAVGVKVQHTARLDAEPEIYRAPLIVSNAGVFNTFMKLVPASYPLANREEIGAFPKGASVVSLFIGFKDSPRKLGFNGENHWIFKSYDHTEMSASSTIQEEPQPQMLYLSFPSLKDPSSTAHTAELLAGGEYDLLEQWQDKHWRRRGQDYQEMKDKIKETLLNIVESRYPGFQDLIEYAELSTPLTIEHFSNSDRGTLYGIPGVPERFDFRWVGSRTPIKNLYLTGSDAFSPGLVGSMIAGLKTIGLWDSPFGFLKIIAAIFFAKASH